MTPLALAMTLFVAHDDGINGYSGKQGQICNACHSGGTAPTVTLTGPTTLNVSESAQYTLTISGGAAVKGGFNVAQSGGATLTPGTGQKTLNSELTQSAPLAFTGGSASFTFTVKAPSAAGMVILFGAGNSVNGNGNKTGDQATGTMLTVTVMGGPPPPVDAGTPTVVDAGTPVQPDAGSPVIDAGTTTPPPPTTVEDAGTTSPTTPPPGSTPSSTDGDPESEIQGGCSTTAGTPLLGLLFAALKRRRSRKPRAALSY